MKLLMFERDGRPCLGLWKDEGIVDLSQIPGAPQTMEEAMGLDALGVIEKLAEGQSTLAPQSVRFLTPVARPEKILCIGLNYKPHIEEFEKSAGLPPYPVIFGKFNNALTPHNGPVRLCSASSMHDYEAEIAVVIGKECKDVPEEKALSYVFGYTLANDITARDLQSRTGQWTQGKGSDTFCPLGPCILTAGSVSYDAMTLEGYKNGELRQKAQSSEMIFPIPFLVSYISKIMTLRPGDLILTGTPSGVISGRPEGKRDWLKKGDRVSVYVGQIGCLENTVEE